MSEWIRQWNEHFKELHRRQYVSLPNGSEKHVTEFQNKSVDKETFQELRMNSYAQDLFFEKMDDELLIDRANYYMGQCGRYNYPAATYDDALIHVIVPELLKRLKGGN